MVRAVVVVVEDLSDSRVGQRRGMPGLGAESGQCLRMLGIFGPQQLDRYRPVQHDIDCSPDFTSPADRDPVPELIPAYEHSSYLSHDNQTLSGSHGSGSRTSGNAVGCPLLAAVYWARPRLVRVASGRPAEITPFPGGAMVTGSRVSVIQAAVAMRRARSASPVRT